MWTLTAHFNPRSPHGERPGCCFCRKAEPRQFQPTLPARGATSYVLCERRPTWHFNPRSPHGERLRRNQYLQVPPYFNPRSPHGERQNLSKVHGAMRHFNPRSPHGERPFRSLLHDFDIQFQPTLPARGATGNAGTGKEKFAISTHAPRTGSDIALCVATENKIISTHAPRTGSDIIIVKPRCLNIISTHAPRTGSDPQAHPLRRTPKSFQPTLPARGATGIEPSDYSRRKHFNPRSPHGERR